MKEKFQVSNSAQIAQNCLLGDFLFKISTRNGVEAVEGKIIKRFDGKLYGLFEDEDFTGKKIISLTCLHTGYRIRLYNNLLEVENDKYLGSCFSSKHSELLKRNPLNDLKNFA